MYLEGKLAYDIFVRGSVYILEGCSEDFMYFYFFFCYIILLYTSLMTIFLRHTLYLFSHIYDDVCCSSPISLYVVSFLSLYTCFFKYAIFIFVLH